MNSKDAATLINLIGFITSAMLYGLLLLMVLRIPREREAKKEIEVRADKLLLAASILGLIWNLGALVNFVIRELVIHQPPAIFMAAAFTSLGFLPAVMVHAVIGDQRTLPAKQAVFWLVGAAYTVSSIAAVLHFYSAIVWQTYPSRLALLMLTLSFATLIVPLYFFTRKQKSWLQTLWVMALAVFAVSALHLSHHDGNHYSWFIELIGHHSSLPLALAILYQDYRFAFADSFLKRALTFVALVGLAFVVYVTIAAPLLSLRDGHISSNPLAVVTLIGIWVATALLYPALRRSVSRFVDKIVLQRADYEELRGEIGRLIATQQSVESVLDEICAKLQPTLTAKEVVWLQTDSLNENENRHNNVIPLVRSIVGAATQELGAALIAALNEPQAVTNPALLFGSSYHISAMQVIPTTECPRFVLVIGQLAAGRRLLSDDSAMLEATAISVARRIDALRITHQRCQQDLREQQMSKLTMEAELKALRAQINPHFLFNALTTIGYLIQTAPERALETLMRLTELLRSVLRSAGEFVTLGEELQLIEVYLEIERQRFEERLRVKIDAPDDCKAARIPSLLIQPLVENAIKHGIAPNKVGGELIISARIETLNHQAMLCISVRDTGVGASEVALAHGRNCGIGLNNIEQRLKNYYGASASLSLQSACGLGALVELKLPAKFADESAASVNERRRA